MSRARVLLVTAAFWMVGSSAGLAPAMRSSAVLPPVMLWAWERPEDVRFIDVDTVGVAYLDRTVTLRGDAIDVRRRQQPLQVTPGTALAAVVRIEADAAAGTAARPRDVANAVVAAVRPPVRLLQLDFDALTSQRRLYRSLLREVRRAMPPDLPLSITALASWCVGDRWIDELQVDEAVPMLFEMGPDTRAILQRLDAGERFPSTRCREAIGVSTREPLRRLPAFSRAYVFNYGAWTPAAVARAIRSVTP